MNAGVLIPSDVFGTGIADQPPSSPHLRMNNKVRVVSHRTYRFRKADTYITAIWHARGILPLEWSHF